MSRLPSPFSFFVILASLVVVAAVHLVGFDIVGGDEQCVEVAAQEAYRLGTNRRRRAQLVLAAGGSV